MPTYSGLWNQVYNTNYAPLGTNNTSELNNTLRKQLSKHISKARGGRKLMAIMKALNGVAPGGAISMNHRRVLNDAAPGQTISNAGVRTVATAADINRVSTAADVAMINGIFDQVFAPNPYPVDRSGNGGGNKRNVGA